MAASSVPVDAERIYSGTVPVILKAADREDRSSTLTVAMMYVHGGPQVPRKVLYVQLTDESDAHLLYTLNISEDDFHAIKTEQSLLIDFPTFPSKVIELLRHCQTASSEEHPRFVASLSTASGSPVFTVTETNPFRQLAHLSLRFLAGNDSAIKKYLAGRLADVKAQLGQVTDELGARTMQLQETAELASQQSERLRTVEEDHARSVAELEVRQAAALADAKEAAVNGAQEQARLAEQERHRIVERCETELSSSRSSQSVSDSDLARLTAAHGELELQLRERSSRLTGAEQDVGLLRIEGSSLREENSSLSAAKHRLEKSLAEREVELAAAQQSVKDKDETLAKTCALLEAAQDAKRQQEDASAMYKDNGCKLQEKLRECSAEIAKGNTIIAKLQSDGRELKGKLRLKAAVMLQQQEHSQAKQAELEASERAVAEARVELANLTHAKERVDEAHAASKVQLAEAQELMRSNQQVIQWLNKELNDAQAGAKPYVSLPPRVGAFRPSAPSTFRPATHAAAAPPPSSAAAPTGVPAEVYASVAAAVAAPGKEVAPEGKGMDFKPEGFVPGAALANLRSRAGVAMAGSLGGRPAAGETMNTGGFAEYLTPSAVAK